MRALTIENGLVANVAKFKDGAKLPKGWIEAPDDVGIGWTDNNDGTFNAPAVEPVPLNQADYSAAIQSTLDDKARELGYDNIFTAVTYADEPAVAKFQSEGIALRAWRSRCWEYAYDILAQVEAGTIQLPSLEDFRNGAPNYE